MSTADWIVGTVAAPLRRRLKQSRIGKPPLIDELRLMIPEASTADLQTMLDVQPYTMTSWERLWALIQSVRYVHARGIEGDVVECGVWRGGSSMAAALALQSVGATNRGLWLFDTFEGMTKPTAHDAKSRSGEQAMAKWLETRTGDDQSDWCRAPIDEVRSNLERTGYPRDRIRLVQGKVEDTLRVPTNLPDRIAILRLDTDWYESTKAELETLFARVPSGGVLIVDDYGSWVGARKAVDEFMATQPPYFMNRIDTTGRLVIKA